MILVDSSAWIDFFRRLGHPEAKQKVAMYLDLNQAAYTCPTLFELMVGARDAEIPVIKETLALCEHVVFQPGYWEKAASIEKTLTRKGTPVPREDVFVAVAAADAGIPVLCRDQHFDVIRDRAMHNLQVVQVKT